VRVTTFCEATCSRCGFTAQIAATGQPFSDLARLGWSIEKGLCPRCVGSGERKLDEETNAAAEVVWSLADVLEAGLITTDQFRERLRLVADRQPLPEVPEEHVYCEACGDCIGCHGEDRCPWSDDGKHVPPRKAVP
jgi:hypothetical protein